MNATVTDSQLGQLAVKQNELFIRVKKGNYASLSNVFDALQQVIEGQAPVPPVRKTKLKSVLLAFENESITLSALANPFNPFGFFKTRSGLWVSDEFAGRVLSQAKVVDKLDSATCSSYNLKKDLYDREITLELSKGYEWSTSEVCACIAQMIERQPNGKEGDLLNNRYANLFYVPGFVVYVFWNADNREWRVSAWELDDFYWDAGFRVFVRN